MSQQTHQQFSAISVNVTAHLDAHRLSLIPLTTHYPTPRSRFLLQYLTVFSYAVVYPHPLAIRIFIALTRARLIPSYFFNNHFNIILAFKSRSFKWSLSFGFSCHISLPVFPPHLSTNFLYHLCSASLSIPLSSYHHPDNIQWGPQITQICAIQLSAVSYRSSFHSALYKTTLRQFGPTGLLATTLQMLAEDP